MNRVQAERELLAALSGRIEDAEPQIHDVRFCNATFLAGQVVFYVDDGVDLWSIPFHINTPNKDDVVDADDEPEGVVFDGEPVDARVAWALMGEEKIKDLMVRERFRQAVQDDVEQERWHRPPPPRWSPPAIVVGSKATRELKGALRARRSV